MRRQGFSAAGAERRPARRERPRGASRTRTTRAPVARSSRALQSRASVARPSSLRFEAQRGDEATRALPPRSSAVDETAHPSCPTFESSGDACGTQNTLEGWRSGRIAVVREHARSRTRYGEERNGAPRHAGDPGAALALAYPCRTWTLMGE